MNKNIFYLIIVVLFSACSSGSGGPDNPEPINTIESQIVGKTFWRVLEGTNRATFTDCIPHYVGLEFNQDGNVYFKYCSDSILLIMTDGSGVWDDTPNYTPITWYYADDFWVNKHIGINNQIFGEYTFIDNKIRITYLEDQIMSFEEWTIINNEDADYNILNNFSDQNNYQDLEVDSISENFLRLNLILWNEIASESQAYLESNIILCFDTDSWVKESNGYTSVDLDGYKRAIVEYTTDVPNCSYLQIHEY